MVVPVVLGFAGSYAAASVIANVLQVGSPWVTTLALGTVFFVVVVLLARRRRQDS